MQFLYAVSDTVISVQFAVCTPLYAVHGMQLLRAFPVDSLYVQCLYGLLAYRQDA